MAAAVFVYFGRLWCSNTQLGVGLVYEDTMNAEYTGLSSQDLVAGPRAWTSVAQSGEHK